MMADPTGWLKFLGPVSFLIPVWLIYLVPILVVAGPIWIFGRKRVDWTGWDFAIAIVPFVLWSALMFTPIRCAKSLSNLVEGPVLGCVANLAPLIRLIVARRVKNPAGLALGLLGVLCLVAVGLWAFVPALPE